MLFIRIAHVFSKDNDGIVEFTKLSCLCIRHGKRHGIHSAELLKMSGGFLLLCSHAHILS